MSTASAAGVIGWQAAPVRHWLRLLRSELRNVFLRPRNLAMLAVLAGAPVFLGAVLKINTPAPRSCGGGAGAFIAPISGNAAFFSLFPPSLLPPVPPPPPLSLRPRGPAPAA